MVPDKFNMVDMGGIDIVFSQGVEVPGLYQKLVESIAQCRYQVLYNWMFDGIIIPPTYVQLEIDDNDNVVINEGIEVDENDVVHIYSLDPEPILPVIQELSVSENGTYVVPENVDGYNPVIVNVPDIPAVIQALNVSENGTYQVPQGVDGYGPVIVDVPSGGFSQDIESYIALTNMGIEYPDYIYDTSVISDLHLVLLSDMSQNTSATTATLSDNISNYSGIVLQGIYSKNRTSRYNSTYLYISPPLNKACYAGTKDKNNNYACLVTPISDNVVTLSGNKQVLIYGIP